MSYNQDKRNQEKKDRLNLLIENTDPLLKEYIIELS